MGLLLSAEARISDKPGTTPSLKVNRRRCRSGAIVVAVIQILKCRLKASQDYLTCPASHTDGQAEDLHMIVSRMASAGIWGSTSATIHSTLFDCSISTRHRGLVSGHWETTVFRADAAANNPAMPFGSVSYLSHLPRQRVLAIHSDVVNYINELGDQGATLRQAFDTVTLHLTIQRFIDKRIEIYEDFGEDNYD